MSNHSENIWQTRAVAAYQDVRIRAFAEAPTELATRLKQLTGRAVDPRAIFVDLDTQTASVAVDGVLFRLRKQELMVVRACPDCGLGRYESAPISRIADLGFALDAWQPPCANCRPEDPPEA